MLGFSLQIQENDTYHFQEKYPEPERILKLGKAIGEGGFGVVHKGWHQIKNRQVAIKIIKDLENEEIIRNELEILEKVSGHENIITFHGAFYQKPNVRNSQNEGLWIAMEFCAGGSIYDLMETKKDYSLGERWISYICKGVLQGLCHLQDLKMIHHDLKPENLMLTRSADIKIIDFGLATVGETSISVAGTATYMAPEVFACCQDNYVEYDNKADVWSLGIIAIEMAEGNAPHSELTEIKFIKRVIHGPPPKLTWTRWSVTFHDFIYQCLKKDPAKRPTAKQLLSHQFIAGMWDERDVKIQISKHLQKCKEAAAPLDDDKIVGGYECTPHSQPWQVYFTQNSQVFCGGSLVTPRWIISAAHCYRP
eukprot:XP_017951221.1 PREDICTED: traf2 and NCK-interacting protein kinase-like [Xenopus tropicalis]